MIQLFTLCLYLICRCLLDARPARPARLVSVLSNNPERQKQKQGETGGDRERERQREVQIRRDMYGKEMEEVQKGGHHDIKRKHKLKKKDDRREKKKDVLIDSFLRTFGN